MNCVDSELWSCTERERQKMKRKGFYYAAQLLMQKHTLESPQPSSRQRNESEKNWVIKQRKKKQRRKYLPSHFFVPKAFNLLRKYCFLFCLISLSSFSCFFWMCKCQMAVTLALSLSLSYFLSFYKACCMLQKPRHTAPPPYATADPPSPPRVTDAEDGWMRLREWEEHWWK